MSPVSTFLGRLRRRGRSVALRVYNRGATQQRYPPGAAGFATFAVVIADSSVSISSFCAPRAIVMCFGGYDGGSYVTTTSPTFARDKPAAAYEYVGPSGGRPAIRSAIAYGDAAPKKPKLLS